MNLVTLDNEIYAKASLVIPPGHYGSICMPLVIPPMCAIPEMSLTLGQSEVETKRPSGLH